LLLDEQGFGKWLKDEVEDGKTMAKRAVQTPGNT